MPARYLRLTAESTYATYNDLADPADVIYPRLPFDDAFNMQMEPMTHFIRDHFTQNRIVDEIAGRKGWTGGQLQTYLYPEQADWFFRMAQPDGNGNARSFTADYFDGVHYQRILGCVIGELEGSMSANQDETGCRLTLSMIAQKEEELLAADFPQPASLGLSTPPYKLTETRGGLIVRESGTSVRTKYNEVSFTLTNQLSANWDEDVYISDITYHGRDITLVGNFRYLDTTDRLAFENRTILQASLVFTKPTTPAKVLTLDFQGNARIENLERSLPLAAPGYQRITLRSFYDESTGTDFNHTYTDV